MACARINSTKIYLNILLLILALFISACAGIEKHDGQAGVSEANLIVRGKVRKIFPETGTLIIKPFRGNLLTLSINEQTELKGYSSLELIEKNNRVQVTYRQNGQSNYAVTVEKLPAGGCE